MPCFLGYDVSNNLILFSEIFLFTLIIKHLLPYARVLYWRKESNKFLGSASKRHLYAGLLAENEINMPQSFNRECF